MALKRKGKREAAPQWLTVDASMKGTLTFNDPVNLQINGQFEGSLDTRGSLAVGAEAVVRADIRGESVIVAGELTGDIWATGLVELQATARVCGNINAPRISILDGAQFNGAVTMQNGAPNPFMNVDELAEYLEVDGATVVQWAEEGKLPGENKPGGWRFERRKVEEWLSQAKISR